MRLRHTLAGYALSALLAALLAAPVVRAQDGAHVLRLSWPSSAGVAAEYLVDTQSFGGMFTANWRLTNGLSHPVEVTFTATYRLQNGTTQTKRKGPIRVRAGGTVRTGWTGDGDVWDRREGGYPVSVNLSDWSVERDN